MRAVLEHDGLHTHTCRFCANCSVVRAESVGGSCQVVKIYGDSRAREIDPNIVDLVSENCKSKLPE